MSGGGSYNRQSSKQQSGPWEGTQPYLKDVYRQAQNQYGDRREFFPDQTYADPTDRENLANAYDSMQAGGTMQQRGAGTLMSDQMQRGRDFGRGDAQQFAQGGNQSPYMQNLYNMSGNTGNMEGLDATAKGQLEATARGDYLNNNPYLDAQFDDASSRIGRKFSEITQPGIASQFGSAGRTGSALQGQQLGMAQGELARELGGLQTDIYGKNYQQERDRQLAGAGALGDLSSSVYSDEANRALDATKYGAQQGLDQQRLAGDLYGSEQRQALDAASLVPGQTASTQANIDRLRGVGERERGDEQRGINEAMDRFYFGESERGDALARYAALIGGLQQQQSSGRSKGYETSGYGGMGGGGKS